jgi:hypothetical protein
MIPDRAPCQDCAVSDRDRRVPDEILGLPLPDALRRAMLTQQWTAPTDPRIVETVFGDEAPQPCFYSPQGMERETRNFRDDPHDVLQQFVGTPPHDIDPDRCVLIGDLGPDQPFALDYRQNPLRPSVVYLHRTADWIQVAADIDSLIDRLGLGVGDDNRA